MPNGKICYVEIPATDVEASANFYAHVFYWKIRTRGDGARAFDDSTGSVSGSWVLDRKSSSDPGILIYIMVDSIEDTLSKVPGAGGMVVTSKTAISSGGEAYATIMDPAANVIGLYEERDS